MSPVSSHPEPFRVYVSAALVLRGRLDVVQEAFAAIEAIARTRDLKLIYQKVSGSPLRIVEEAGP